LLGGEAGILLSIYLIEYILRNNGFNEMKKRAYLDIETTGLSRYDAELTVIGIAHEGDNDCTVTQLVGDDITQDALLEALTNTDEIYTYNGSRFDLPFIAAQLDFDLKRLFPHTDLMYACWKRNLKGGLKVVEQRMGIGRRLKDVNGFEAVRLWWDYCNNCNEQSLKTLLDYNEEDIVNLIHLRKRLGID